VTELDVAYSRECFTNFGASMWMDIDVINTVFLQAIDSHWLGCVLLAIITTLDALNYTTHGLGHCVVVKLLFGLWLVHIVPLNLN
jgi:hypothetical protein